MHWRGFDQSLYALKIGQLSRGWHKKTRDATTRVRAEQKRIGQGEGVGFYAKLADARIAVLCEHLEDVDGICREVWRAQGGTLTPAFVREVIRNFAVLATIRASCASIRGEIELMARRTRFLGLAPVLGHLMREKGQLESDWSNRYEIEARELELQAKLGAAKVAELSVNSRAVSVISSVTQRHGESLVVLTADLWREFHDKFKSLANEERSILRKTREDRRLRVYCTYNSDRTPHESQLVQAGIVCLLYRLESGIWDISKGPSEEIKASFVAQATRAGTQLGHPCGTTALDFWLHSLCLDLRITDSRKLFAPSDTGGIITEVCEASAIFCSRLEKKALDLQAADPAETPNRDRVMLFVESAGGRSTTQDRPEPATSYSKARTKTLENRLTEILGRFHYLEQRFPDWKVCGSGYGPGNELPAYYTEIRRLQKDRESILLELSKRLKSEALSESVKPKARRAKRMNAVVGRRSSSPKSTEPADGRKGDPSLLDRKDRVTFRIAEEYLGVTERQRQNLIKRGSLTVEGQGHNRKITTESLRKYLPPENPK